MCAVGALRSETWAEDRVFDSDMTPLAEAVLGQAAKPYIVCYTDIDSIAPVDPQARLYDGMNRDLTLTIEIGVASALRQMADDGTPTGPIAIQFAATDEGMEFAVDLIESQVIAALIGQPKSRWGELFKIIVPRVTKMQSRRGGQAERGIRFAARQVRLVLETLSEPVPGFVPPEGHFIRQFINLAREMPQSGVIDAAAGIETMLYRTATPDWRQAQAFLGVTEEGAKILMVPGSPLPYPEIEEPPYDPQRTDSEFAPPLERVTVDDTDGRQIYDVIQEDEE